MTTKTLTLWGNGAVTLPKEWRDQFPTRHFIAEQTPKGLLIKPIVDVEYYEEEDGSFGLRFPTGIDAGDLATMLRQADKNIRAEEKKKRSKNSKKASR